MSINPIFNWDLTSARVHFYSNLQILTSIGDESRREKLKHESNSDFSVQLVRECQGQLGLK